MACAFNLYQKVTLILKVKPKINLTSQLAL